jgi:hypothetical protein
VNPFAPCALRIRRFSFDNYARRPATIRYRDSIGTAGIKLATLEPGDAKSFSLERKAKQCLRGCPSAAALVPSSANRPVGYPGMR